MIKRFVPSGFCLKCRGCCRFVEEKTIWAPRLLNEELKRIPQAAVVNQQVLLSANPKDGNFLCFFFDAKNNKCRIYSRRPFECRLYPFLIHRQDDKIFLAADKNCSFIAENPNSPAFIKYTEYLAGILNQPPYSQILKDNLHIFLSYPDTLIIQELKGSIK